MDKKIVDKLVNAGLISYTNIDASKYNDVKELLANGIISTPIELDKLYMLVGETNTDTEIEVETESKVEDTEVKDKEPEIEVETESKVEDTEVNDTEPEIEVEDIQVVDKVKESNKPSKKNKA